jgi:hypothetical protein
MKSLFRLMTLLCLMVAMGWGQGQIPPTGFVTPFSMAGTGPNGAYAKLTVDGSGNLNVTGSSAGVLAYIPGFVTPYAPVAQDSLGIWHFLLVDASGNLKTTSSGGASCTGALTLNNSGSGSASGTSYNCLSAVTVSYNTIGAAPLASPTFTGTVTMPDGSSFGTVGSLASGAVAVTGTSGDSSTLVATDAFVANAVSGLGPAGLAFAVQAMNSTATGFAGIAAPTTPPSVPQVFTSTPSSGSAATAAAWALPGIAGRSVSTTTDTIVATDCSPNRIEYTGSAATAVALPTATTLAVPKCVFKLANIGTGVVTVTPTTWTVNGNATLLIEPNQQAWFYVDPNNATNWSADVNGETYVSQLGNALATNTLANGNFPQIWQWALTTPSLVAMSLGEASASSGSANQILNIQTLSGSTATPLTIQQAAVTGTTTIPAINIAATWNNSGLTGSVFKAAVTNTSSAATSSFIVFTGGTAGTTAEFGVDTAGDLQVAGVITGTVTTGVMQICGGSSITCSQASNAAVGGPFILGNDNSNNGAGVKAGPAIFRGGMLTNAAPNAAAIEGVVQVGEGYLKGSAIANVGDVLCGTTVAFTVTDCPTSATNIIGIATITTTPVGVVSYGTALVKTDGAITALGDHICGPTTTAGLAHDNGGTVCAVGTSVGTVIADSGNVTQMSANTTATTAMSTTLVLVQLHID